MMKNFKRLFCLTVLAALIITAAGCAGDKTQGAGGQPPTDGPDLFFYADLDDNYGVINSEGRVVVPPCGDNCQILYDMEGRQRYVMRTHFIFDPERCNYYDEPLVAAYEFTFYDKQGAVADSLNIELPEGGEQSDVLFAFAPDGTLGHSRFLVNTLEQNGGWRLLDCEGNVLVEKQAAEPGRWRYCYCYLELADGFAAVKCSFNAEDWSDSEERIDFYDAAGEPLTMERAYANIWPCFDEIAREYSGYYAAQYTGAQGQYLIDVLDSDGRVVISELSELGSLGNGLFVVKRGFDFGLMNAEGEWVYKESVFNGLDD